MSDKGVVTHNALVSNIRLEASGQIGTSQKVRIFWAECSLKGKVCVFFRSMYCYMFMFVRRMQIQSQLKKGLASSHGSISMYRVSMGSNISKIKRR